ncbi:MAG: peptidylprolyl isomerase [Ignavibacteriales bacterium]|nr:peptidylprolyl isomerase [Ignavibacteriales bacterium]
MRIPLFLLLFVFSATAQTPDDIPLVDVGPIRITLREFVSRYELVPGINRRASDLEANKSEFLLSLIAEKLLVIRARQKGLDDGTAVTNALKEVERSLVRDELYRREVRQKVEIPDAEMRVTMQRSLNDLKIYFLFAKTKSGADFLYSEMRRGKPLESFSFVNDTSGEFAGPDSAIARWGDVDERMEQVIYNLQLNQTSEPLQLDDGWYIVKLMGKTMTFLAGEKEKKAARERVEQVLRKRKELIRMSVVMDTELKNTKTEINARLFRSVVGHLWTVAQQRNPGAVDSIPFFVDYDAVERVRAQMKDSMALTVVTFPHSRWNLEQALTKIRETNLATTQFSAHAIRLDVQQRLKDLIDQEYMAELGYKKNLHQSAAVQKDLNVWRDAYMSQYIRGLISDTVAVTREEIEELRRILSNDTSIVRHDDAAREKMREIKTRVSLDRFVGAAANNVEITIYERNFKNVHVSATPSMVFRYLGFGGRMFAVPFVVPQVGWIEYWNSEKVKLP